MTTLPRWPQLLDTVPAAVGQRVARALLSFALVVAPGWVIGAATLQVLGANTTSQAWWYAAAVAAGVSFVALVGAAWVALSGRTIPDYLLGLRTVRVDTGGRPGWRGLGRASVMGLLAIPSAGVVPLLLIFLTRDADGRCWQDRWAGLSVLDVRSGRDVGQHPVTRAELSSRFAPARAPRPAIIHVRPEEHRPDPAFTQQPLPAPQPITASGARAVAQAEPTALTFAATEPAAQPAWVLCFDTGQTHELRSLALLGRQPTPRSTHPGAELVVVDDPSRTISATHLAVRPNEVGVWVEDLGSTNGSEVVLANGRVKALPVRARTAVDGDAIVRFGDRVMRLQRSVAVGEGVPRWTA